MPIDKQKYFKVSLNCIWPGTDEKWRFYQHYEYSEREIWLRWKYVSLWNYWRIIAVVSPNILHPEIQEVCGQSPQDAETTGGSPTTLQKLPVWWVTIFHPCSLPQPHPATIPNNFHLGNVRSPFTLLAQLVLEVMSWQCIFLSICLLAVYLYISPNSLQRLLWKEFSSCSPFSGISLVLAQKLDLGHICSQERPSCEIMNSTSTG